MDALAGQARFRPSKDVTFRAVGSEGLLVDLRSGRCWELNRVATEIWQRLCQEQPVARILEQLTAAYPAEAARLAGDVTRLVDELSTAGLLTAAGEQPP